MHEPPGLNNRHGSGLQRPGSKHPFFFVPVADKIFLLFFKLSQGIFLLFFWFLCLFFLVENLSVGAVRFGTGENENTF